MIKINLPETIVVGKGPRDKAWRTEVTIDTSKLSDDIVAKLAVHGLAQKIADSASQAKTIDEASAAMNKALDALYNGEWSSRGSAGVDEFTLVMRSVVRAAFNASNAKGTSARDSFAKLDDDAQNDKLAEWFTANEAAFRPAIEAEIADRKRKREAKATLAAKVSFKL